MHSPLTTPQTIKQMMKDSIPFKFCFVGAITLVVAVIIMGIILPFSACNSYSYHTCTYYYGSYYYYECYSSSYGSTYCCNNNFYYCGDSNCYYKPSDYYHYNSCMGVFIAMWVCSGVSFILMVATFIMFCNFQGRAKKGLVLVNPPNYANYVDSSNQNPIYVSSNSQPIRAQQTQNLIYQ